jgi:hypothetical protein
MSNVLPRFSFIFCWLRGKHKHFSVIHEHLCSVSQPNCKRKTRRGKIEWFFFSSVVPLKVFFVVVFLVWFGFLPSLVGKSHTKAEDF